MSHSAMDLLFYLTVRLLRKTVLVLGLDLYKFWLQLRLLSLSVYSHN